MSASATTAGHMAAEPAPWRIVGYLLLVLAASGFLLQAWWIIEGDPHPGWYSDSLFYLILADFYSGHSVGEVPNLSMKFYEISRFPPLFPIALALGGAGIQNWIAAYYIVLGFGLVSLLTSFLWLRQQTDRAFVAAALLPLAILSPEYFFLHLEIVSESQFVFLFTLVLILVGLCERRKCSVLTVSAVAGLLPLSRTAGLTVLIAMSVWLAVKQREIPGRRRLLAGIVMWLPALAWMLYRRMYPVSLDYVGELTNPISSGVGPWLVDTLREVPRLAEGYATWFDLAGEGPAYGIAVAILTLAAIGWYRRIRDLHVDALFLPIYLCLIAIWPYPVDVPRLLSITMPVVALSAWSGLNAFFVLANTGRYPRALPTLAAILLLCAALLASGPEWTDVVHRATAQLDPELTSAKRTVTYFATPPNQIEHAAEVVTRFVEMGKALPEAVADGDCVWTPLFAVTAFFSSFKVRLYPTPESIDSIDAARQKLGACRYILVVNLLSPHLQYRPLYPAKFLEWARPRLVSRMGDERGGYVAAALLDLRD